MGSVLAGCQEPEPLPAPTPAPPAAEPPEPTVEEPAAAFEQPIPEEPDWKAMYERKKAGFLQVFTPPRPGDVVTVKLKNRTKNRGRLVSIENGQVMLAIPDGSVGFAQSTLHGSSRVTFFAEDFASWNAAKSVDAAKTAYRDEVAAIEARNRKFRNYVAKKPAPAPRAPGMVKHRALPVVDSTDGSIVQVKEWLLANSRRANTIEFHDWSRIKNHKEGYIVECTYSIDTASFGRAKERKFFILDQRGNVVRSAPVRDAVPQG